jgi:hypothetical protein
MISISGSTSGECHSVNRIGRMEPVIAPMVNWPSAPMFQLLER